MPQQGAIWRNRTCGNPDSSLISRIWPWAVAAVKAAAAKGDGTLPGLPGNPSLGDEPPMLHEARTGGSRGGTGLTPKERLHGDR
jgi:hypothetical protein